ncbi:MAG: uracil-DNA glycosylase [candidate division WOR-3 bacterium]
MKDRSLPLFYLREFFGLREFYLPGTRDRIRSLSLLAEVAALCKRCPLVTERKRNVFGWGNPYARLMLVGEGPGKEEDELGKPFVGKSGALLTRLLSEIGLDRERDVYIANVVKCRPPENRDPAPGEISACFRFLKLQVEIISPDLILALGRFSARTLLGLPLEERNSLEPLRGKLHRSVLGPALIATYHPSYVSRNKTKPEVIAAARKDFAFVASVMGWK